MIWTNVLAPIDNLGELLKEKFFIEVYGAVPTIEVLMRNKPVAYQNSYYGTQPYRMKQMFDKLFGQEPINLVTAVKALNIPRFGDVNAAKLAQYPEMVKSLINFACDGSCADGLKLAALFEEFKARIGVANSDILQIGVRDNMSIEEYFHEKAVQYYGELRRSYSQTGSVCKTDSEQLS